MALLRSCPALVLAAALAAGLSAQDAIKVGEVASLTGKEAAYGQASHDGTLLAVEEINAAGGVLGRPLELITLDDESKLGEAGTAARKLISRDKVVALLGEVASGRSMEMAPLAQNARIPMISPSSTNPRVTQVGNYIFRVCFTDPFQGAVLAKFALAHLHARRIAILTSVSSAYSVGLSKYFREPYLAGGGKIVAEQKYSEGDRDFKAQLTAIQASGADGLLVSGYYTEAALVCVQAKQLGLAVPIFGGDGWEAQELITIGGDAVEGKFYSTHFSPASPDPAVQAFVARFRKRWGAEPDGMAALGYDSAGVLAAAIQRAGTTEPAALRDAIAATRDYPGVTGPTTLDAHRDASKPAVILTVKDGKFALVETVTP
ncbi:MAG TPA: ABC transporter substrate-binding protein [Opitutaceae bacterium]|nr:ABC transporter substrate-binding protein [Opitutaceae bacterium]